MPANRFSIDKSEILPNYAAEDDVFNLLFGKDINPIKGEEENKQEEQAQQQQTPPQQKEPDSKEEPKKSSIESLFENEQEEEQIEEEEEEEEQQAESPQEDIPSNLESEEGISIFQEIAKSLFDAGIFTKQENEDPASYKDAASLKERFEYEKKLGAYQEINDFLERFGEDYKEAFKAIFIDGVHPKDYLAAYVNKIDISSIDLSVEKNQEYIVERALRSLGLEDEEIKKEIDKLKNYGDLEDSARRYHKVLLKKEEENLKKLQQQRQEELERQKQFEEQYATQLKKIISEKVKERSFDGYPITPKVGEKLFDFLYTKKWKLPTGETLTDFDRYIIELNSPENFQKKAKLALLLINDLDLSKVEKQAISKKSDEIFSTLADKVTKIKSRSGVEGKRENNSTNLFESLLKEI